MVREGSVSKEEIQRQRDCHVAGGDFRRLRKELDRARSKIAELNLISQFPETATKDPIKEFRTLALRMRAVRAQAGLTDFLAEKMGIDIQPLIDLINQSPIIGDEEEFRSLQSLVAISGKVPDAFGDSDKFFDEIDTRLKSLEKVSIVECLIEGKVKIPTRDLLGIRG